MAIDPSGATTLDSWQPDHEGRLLAYQLSEGGREESVLRVMDVATGADVDGPIDRCRYTAVAWLPGGAGVLLQPPARPGRGPGWRGAVPPPGLPAPGSARPPDDDVLILGDGLDKTNYYGVSVSRDGRWLVITASAGTAPRDDVWVADLTRTDPAAPELMVLQQGVDARTWPVAGPRRPAVPADRRRGAAAPDRRRRSGAPGVPGRRELAGTARRGRRGRAQ